MEEKLDREEKKEPITPVFFVPGVDKDGYAVFECINKDDAELLKTALNSKGVKVKSSKENTCPLEPDKPYAESVCAKLDELFKKARKKRKCKTCDEIE